MRDEESSGAELVVEQVIDENFSEAELTKALVELRATSEALREKEQELARVMSHLHLRTRDLATVVEQLKGKDIELRHVYADKTAIESRLTNIIEDLRSELRQLQEPQMPNSETGVLEDAPRNLMIGAPEAQPSEALGLGLQRTNIQPTAADHAADRPRVNDTQERLRVTEDEISELKTQLEQVQSNSSSIKDVLQNSYNMLQTIPNLLGRTEKTTIVTVLQGASGTIQAVLSMVGQLQATLAVDHGNKRARNADGSVDSEASRNIQNKRLRI